MLIENEKLLKLNYLNMWESLQTFHPYFQSGNVVIETAKNDSPTLKVESGSRPIYLHSKYDPIAEAESFIKKFDDVDSYKHIFFYGLGMGYHIEALMKLHPDKVFTVFEPNPEILYRFLETRQLSVLPLHLLQHFYIEWNSEVITHCLSHFLEFVKEKTLLVIHPSYERLNVEKTRDFTDRFKKALTSQMNSIGVNARFERLWTLNSMLNFQTILDTPHIIREKKAILENKPALLVAAGPSLEDELEHIKYIKDNKLAYIFSVGSAIKALLRHGIEPDAVCAYDPETGLDGLDTFQEIIESNIKSVPLIFGSSLGFNTVRRYTGSMLHVFTTQDTISPFYLGEDQAKRYDSIVSDAPSIALVTLEILSKLGCNPVILVGQNFAYRNNQYYAAGIQYDTRPNQLSDEEKKSLLEVESTEEDIVLTSRSHNDSRITMEHYISLLKHITIINTTKGGAKIAGAEYQPLERLIQDQLIGEVVIKDWYIGEKTQYDLQGIKTKVKVMEKEYKSAVKYMDDLVQILRSIERLSNMKAYKQLEQKFIVYDRNFKKLQNNAFFTVYLQPMLRLQLQVLHRFIPEIRNEKNIYEKARKLVDNFGKFILDCQREIAFITPEYNKLQNKLLLLGENAAEEVAK